MRKSGKGLTRSFKFTSISLLLFLVWIFLAPFLAERLIVEKPLKRADAIVILGGSSVYLERARKAARLYKDGIAPKIFLTNDGTEAGWSKMEERNPPYVELAKKSLIEQGVPAENIEILPGIVESTHDEANLLAETARKRNLKSLLIVTSAYHTRRAFQSFRKVFEDNSLTTEIGIESSPTGEQTPAPIYWWLTTSGWRWVAAEYVKSIYYWLYY